MKLKLIALTALSTLALSSSILANDPQDATNDQRGGRGMRRGSLDRMTDDLNLTPEQKAKVQPILNQARPQIAEIHRDAMQKTKTVMDNAMVQIRPLLTPEQQKKLDDAQNDRRGGREARAGRRAHRGQGGQDQDSQDNGGDQ
jgi:Spy/CpxP family protein refolding chaperone